MGAIEDFLPLRGVRTGTTERQSIGHRSVSCHLGGVRTIGIRVILKEDGPILLLFFFCFCVSRRKPSKSASGV